MWDFNVAVFHVINWYSKISGSFKKEVEEKLVRGAFALHINRGPDMLPRHTYRMLFVADKRFSDSHNYWRNNVMQTSPVVKQALTMSPSKKTTKELEVKRAKSSGLFTTSVGTTQLLTFHFLRQKGMRLMTLLALFIGSAAILRKNRSSEKDKSSLRRSIATGRNALTKRTKSILQTLAIRSRMKKFKNDLLAMRV